jgi:putative addiction module component (TIGR02574 family)
MGSQRAMGKPRIEIDALSKAERLDLLEQVWESLSRTPLDLPVTAQQQAELDRRSDQLDQDLAEGRPIGVPWDEVMRQLRTRR